MCATAIRGPYHTLTTVELCAHLPLHVRDAEPPTASRIHTPLSYAEPHRSLDVGRHVAGNADRFLVDPTFFDIQGKMDARIYRRRFAPIDRPKKKYTQPPDAPISSPIYTTVGRGIESIRAACASIAALIAFDRILVSRSGVGAILHRCL